MAPKTPNGLPGRGTKWPLLGFALLLLGILALLFFRSFLPGMIHFNNDTPLGVIKTVSDHLLENFTGWWSGLNSVGMSIGAATPTVTWVLLYVLGPVGFAKFFAPAAIFIVGVCAWIFFRQLKLSPLACVLGGLAAALNSGFFATACWGVASQIIGIGMCFLAMAAVVSDAPRGRWVRLALAGLAVGMLVMEAADIGALFSLLVAAFVMYQALAETSQPVPKRLAWGTLRVALIAGLAGFAAFNMLKETVGAQIHGVAGMEDTPEAKAQRWDWATQWSLPKRETLGVAIPGLFGFRMDSSQHGLPGGDYWGAGGRDPSWDRYFASDKQGPPPHKVIRYGGGGMYMGLLVVLVTAWAAAQALRKQGSVFTLPQRKMLGFWLAVMVVSLLLAFGRHAPFYWLLYQLPYFSTIRNPSKFGHILTYAMVVVFAYGVDGLSRRYLETASAASTGAMRHVRSWWGKVQGFDRKWTLGCLLALGVCLLGWLVYASSRASLESYLQTVQFGADQAHAIAGFSIEHVGWFILRLVLGIGLLTLVLSGWFAGARAKWAGLVLGLFLAGDLALANRPWIIYWDYPQKYATNPIIDQLRQQPYEHRVAILPSWIPGAFSTNQPLLQAEQFLDQLYEIEWKQQHFQYYGIQTLDIVQMPRVPADLDAFERALQFRGTQDSLYLVSRRWQLTNTRYLLGAAPLLELLNKVFDPVQQRFQIASRFNLGLKPEVAQFTGRLTELTAEPSTNGNYALFEFTGALPRAKLFTNWQVCAQNPALVKEFITTDELEAAKAAGTNDFLTLKELAAPSFDPAQTVLVAETPGLKPSSPATNAPAAGAGSVAFVSYLPKDIVLQAKAAAPSVLLLNDKFDPGWKVTVDGKPETLLRCNYLMRGVQVPAGEHRVEFRFAPPVPGIYPSLAALGLGVLLLGVLAFGKPSRSATNEEAEPRKP